MSTTPSRLVSVAEYLTREKHSTVKHEYVAGNVYAMAGASNAHNMIASNVLISLGGQLDGNPCRAFNADTKIRVRLSDQTRFYYPDVSIICAPNPQSDSFQDQPSVIVEVLSDSTRRLDEGEKREAYLTLPTLTHYILLEQSFATAIVYERASVGFDRRVLSDLNDSIELPEAKAVLQLAAAYDGVELAKP